jgi:hypothetical protein
MNNKDFLDKELSELQRQEALSDNEEYEINDKVYEDSPITRQFVADEVITGTAELVDNMPPVKSEKHGDIIYDVDDEEIIQDDKQTGDTEIQRPILEDDITSETKIKVKKSLPVKQISLISTDREYLDRKSVLKASDQEKFEVIKKPQKEKKKIEVQISWKFLKPMCSVLLLTVSIILAMVVFNGTKNYVADSQIVNSSQQTFIDEMSDTIKLVTIENNEYAKLQQLTEKYLIDVIGENEYKSELSDILNALTEKTNEYIDKDMTILSIQSSTIDYVNNTINIIKEVIENTDKKAILNSFNNGMSKRETLYGYLTSQISEKADTLDLEMVFEENIFHVNIKQPI